MCFVMAHYDKYRESQCQYSSLAFTHSRRRAELRQHCYSNILYNIWLKGHTHVFEVQYLYLLAHCSNCSLINFPSCHIMPKLNFQVFGCKEEIFFNLKSFHAIFNVEVAIKKSNIWFLILMRKFFIFINCVYCKSIESPQIKLKHDLFLYVFGQNF